MMCDLGGEYQCFGGSYCSSVNRVLWRALTRPGYIMRLAGSAYRDWLNFSPLFNINSIAIPTVWRNKVIAFIFYHEDETVMFLESTGTQNNAINKQKNKSCYTICIRNKQISEPMRYVSKNTFGKRKYSTLQLTFPFFKKKKLLLVPYKANCSTNWFLIWQPMFTTYTVTKI
jgi:hypothetical protein